MKVTSRKPKPGETVFGGGTGVLLGGFAKQQPDPKKNGPATREPEEDDLVRWMTREGITVTREKYVALAYPDGLPEEWTAELEAQLPQELQRPFLK